MRRFNSGRFRLLSSKFSSIGFALIVNTSSVEETSLPVSSLLVGDPDPCRCPLVVNCPQVISSLEPRGELDNHLLQGRIPALSTAYLTACTTQYLDCRPTPGPHCHPLNVHLHKVSAAQGSASMCCSACELSLERR